MSVAERAVTNHRSLRRAQLALFARNFIKHPMMLGSVIPSSRFLVSQVLGRIDWTKARVIVEYGPGVGNFTRAILERMHPEATLVAIEMNEDFVRFLGREFPDPRLKVVHGSAAEVRRILEELGFAEADAIVSGIPFSTMPASLREAVLRSSRDILSAEGAFFVYQFSARVRRDLEKVFGKVDRYFEPLNILPARLFVCGRQAA